MLIHADCMVALDEIADNSVNLVMTSPPYAMQRGYGGAESYKYLDFISPIAHKLKDKIKPDGSIIINIKEHCNKGVRDLYVYKMVIHFVEVLGLNFVDEFVWVKTNPFPTGSKTRFKDGWERCLHFTKGKHAFYPEQTLVKSESKWLESEKRRANKGEHNVTNGSGMNMTKRVCQDMVRPSNVIIGSSSNINIGHPAVYPKYLPEYFIKAFTKEGDTVLDPFMGSGTTGISAKELNRKFIGIEKQEDYFNIALNRLGENYVA